MVFISEKDCHAVMEVALKGKSFDITDFNLQPFSDIMGFHGSHALLNIKAKVGGKEKDFQFFVKLATKNQVVFDKYFGRMKMFLKEHVVITKLMKELQTQVGKRLTAECCLSRLNRFLVLEHLSDINYEIIRKKGGIDLVHAKVAIQTFADFHASSFLLEDKGTKIIDKYPEVLNESLFARPDDDTPDLCVMISCHRGLSAWAEKEYKDMPSNVRKISFEKVLERIALLVKPSKKFRNVLCHGDPWGNNIMYRYENECPIDGILVDFQAVRYAPPAVDLMQFLYVALDAGLREKHGHELLDVYHSRLSETLNSRSLDVEKVLPRAVLDETCHFYREFGIDSRLYYSYITRIPGRYLEPAITDVQRFLGLMIEGDPAIPLAAAEDPLYAGELKAAIDGVVEHYTGYSRGDKPDALASS